MDRYRRRDATNAPRTIIILTMLSLTASGCSRHTRTADTTQTNAKPRVIQAPMRSADGGARTYGQTIPGAQPAALPSNVPYIPPYTPSQQDPKQDVPVAVQDQIPTEQPQQSEVQMRVPARTTSTAALPTGRICSAAIGMLTGRDPAGIAIQREDGRDVRVGYLREDGSPLLFQCNVADGTIVWRPIDGDGPGTGPGRWRDQQGDDPMNYVVNDQGVFVVVNGDTTRIDR